MEKSDKKIKVEPSTNLYKWAKNWGKLQRNYYSEPVVIRREKQIEDFIILNEYKNVKFVTDTDVFSDFKNCNKVFNDHNADLVVITDQKFSRYPCQAIINNIKSQLQSCPDLYLCLNRHYINIDNSFVDKDLSDNFNLAITQWLKKNLPYTSIIDLSRDYLDFGSHFTWVIPDRHYFMSTVHESRN